MLLLAFLHLYLPTDIHIASKKNMLGLLVATIFYTFTISPVHSTDAYCKIMANERYFQTTSGYLSCKNQYCPICPENPENCTKPETDKPCYKCCYAISFDTLKKKLSTQEKWMKEKYRNKSVECQQTMEDADLNLSKTVATLHSVYGSVIGVVLVVAVMFIFWQWREIHNLRHGKEMQPDTGGESAQSSPVLCVSKTNNALITTDE